MKEYLVTVESTWADRIRDEIIVEIPEDSKYPIAELEELAIEQIRNRYDCIYFSEIEIEVKSFQKIEN